MISGAKQENLNGGEQRENQQWKWGGRRRSYLQLAVWSLF